MVKQTLILASSSPRRQELIMSLKLPVHIHASDVDESVEEQWSPEEIVEQLAYRKAAETAQQLKSAHNSGIVIGSDTIVVLDGQILGKPIDAEEAKRMLQKLQGKTHQVFSGVACIDLASGIELIRHRMTRVSMKILTTSQINHYVQSGEPMDKAGSYAIQGLGALLIDQIEGCYFNVVGLPLSLLSDMLAELGTEVL